MFCSKKFKKRDKKILKISNLIFFFFTDNMCKTSQGRINKLSSVYLNLFMQSEYHNKHANSIKNEFYL